jgi:predicted RNase H-like HicB family nuclease
MKHFTFSVVIEADSDGYYAFCPALQGCYSQGDTYEDAVSNIKDAIRLHIEDRIANGEEIPEQPSVSLSTVEVAV